MKKIAKVALVGLFLVLAGGAVASHTGANVATHYSGGGGGHA